MLQTQENMLYIALHCTTLVTILHQLGRKALRHTQYAQVSTLHCTLVTTHNPPEAKPLHFTKYTCSFFKQPIALLTWQLTIILQ